MSFDPICLDHLMDLEGAALKKEQLRILRTEKLNRRIDYLGACIMPGDQEYMIVSTKEDANIPENATMEDICFKKSMGWLGTVWVDKNIDDLAVQVIEFHCRARE